MKNFHYFRKKSVLIVGITACLGAGLLLPSAARADYWQDLFSGISDAYQQAYSQASYYLNNLNQFTDEFPDHFKVVLEESLGDMGLGDPQLIEQEVTESIFNLPEIKPGQNMALIHDATQDIERYQTEAYSDHILSKEEQVRTAEKIQLNQQNIALIEQHTQAGLQSVSTHDAIKHLLQIVNQQSSITAGLSADMQQDKQAQALANKSLVRIDRQLDKEARQKRSERMSKALSLLQFNFAPKTYYQDNK